MTASEKRTFTLPAEQSAFIDQLVTSGAYATASEVIRDGLRALQERNAAVERWLREEVARTYDAMKADPSRGVPLADVIRRVEQPKQRSLLPLGGSGGGLWGEDSTRTIRQMRDEWTR